jgi:glutathione reductase (NADPH)
VAAANLLAGQSYEGRLRCRSERRLHDPPLARVGLDEEEAHRRQLRFSVRLEDTSRWNSSRRVGEAVSGRQALIEEGTDRIIGAHLLGPRADETINIFALAIRAGIPISQLRPMLWAYPTHASDIAYL